MEVVITSIGNDCLLMIGTHIAHDCQIGNNVIFANHSTLAGHVKVFDNVVVGALSAIHQFSRIGECNDWRNVRCYRRCNSFWYSFG